MEDTHPSSGPGLRQVSSFTFSLDLMLTQADFLAGLHFVWGITSHALSEESLKFLHNCFTRAGHGRKHPNTFEVRIGGSRTVFTADPDNIKALLTSQFDSFGKGKRFRRDWSGLVGNSLFLLDGHEWYTARQRLRPLFSRQRISDLDCFERHVQDLLPLLDGGHTVNIMDLLGR